MNPKERLAQAELDLASTTMSLMETINKLKAEIAAAEKPKLRHGDYGYDVGGKPCAAMRYYDDPGKKLRAVSTTCIHTVDCSEHTECVPKTVIGNIFDDLKAMKEDLTEFEIEREVHNGEMQAYLGHSHGSDCSCKCSQKPHDSVYIHTGTSGWFSLDQLAKIIKSFRQMEATAKRNK